MTRLNDNSYKADKGKIFILTEKGKEWASYKDYEVGKPIDSDSQYAPVLMVEGGALIEVNDPDFVRLPGYKAVYNHNGYELTCGNPYVYFDREIAEKIASRWEKCPWNNGKKAYVVEATYEGKHPKPCREYNGKRVYNEDWWFYDAAIVGDLVEEEVVEHAINALPPACMRSDCMQMGEPHSSRIDENIGKYRTTYQTFKKIDKGVYEYCGDCFRGENEMRGKEISYMA